MTYFNSRDPYGPRSAFDFSRCICRTFQFTRPIRAAIGVRRKLGVHFLISIHATHTGRDAHFDSFQPGAIPISIHATHTGRDPSVWTQSYYEQDFNSRDPYGPRCMPKRTRPRFRNFNSRDPYGPRFHRFLSTF